MKNYKYRIYAKGGKLKKLQSTLDTCRFVFNKVLELRKAAYDTEKKSLSVFECNKLIATWNVKNVHSQVLQNVSRRVDLAFQGFFHRLKENKDKKAGSAAGYPRFRGKDRYDSFCYPQSGFSLKNEKLQLSKIGEVKIILHRPMEGKIKTCTIKKEGEDWFAIFSCEIDRKVVTRTDNTPVGIDLGCIDFVTMSDGSSILNPHYLRISEEKLKLAQSKYSKLKQLPKEDKKKIRAKRPLVKLHCKVRNQRNDFLHKASHRIAKDYSLICIEKLNIKSMLKDNWKALNKSILDSGWSTFCNMLNYKAEEAGSLVVKVNPAYTSQICSDCEVRVKKKLNERIHNCNSCGLKISRDLNAARNILRLGMESLTLNSQEAHSL
jgi:putative transposase